MVTSLPSPALTADPLGQRLWQLFGGNPWDFLEAPTPSPGDKPQWRTVKNYPLRPRILWQRWKDATTLIGVRFKSQTYYALIDIDAGSPYCNPEAIAQLRASLETIGITRTLLLRSSHSNGLHLYVPLPESIKTFDLAVALEECLTTQDFALAPKGQSLTIANGTLEIFPNPKPYGVEKIIHYNGHRLPLQPGTGSCLLDDDLNPIGDKLDRFFWLWDGAASHQDMDALREALKIGRDNRRKKPRLSRHPNSTIDAWRADLELEIEEGWSGLGQTNHLLKTIACHGHVFLGLAGDALFTHSLETATQLSGYQQYCRHQHEIEYKVKAWCKAVEKYYWPLGDDPKRDTSSEQPPKLNVNQQRAKEAQQRIKKAIATLRQIGTLPDKVSDLAQQLVAIAHCSLQTIYKYANLWHPNHIQASEEARVIAQSESDPAVVEPADLPQSAQPSLSPDPPKAWSKGPLHTQERFMKCIFAPPLPQKNLPERGVRGEVQRFPQIAATPAEPFLPYGEAHAAIQQKVQALHWSLTQVRQFLAEHFQGRDRIWDLQEHELTTYLYHLQVASLAHEKC